VRIGVPLGLVGLLLLGVLKFTYIGQGNYEVQRMRGALSPTEDASFQTRLANQQRLLPYLATHPLGGGIGSAGYWGQRFSPGTFLADLALDSYYVKIAAEGGYVGVTLFGGLVVVSLVYGRRRYAQIPDPVHAGVVAGMWSVVASVSVVSYSNQYFGQMPTGLFVYLAWAVFVRGPELE